MCDALVAVVASPGRTARGVDTPLADAGAGTRGERETVYKPWSSTTEVPAPPLDRPVWVHLDRLYGPPDDESAAGIVDPSPDGWLQVDTPVPGLLKRWKRPTDGRWFGCRPGLELTVDRSACRSFRQGRTVRTPDAAAWLGDTGA